MDWTHIVAIASGVITGAIFALKVIAPKTSTTIDDKVLKALEYAESILKMSQPAPTTTARASVVDHRSK